MKGKHSTKPHVGSKHRNGLLPQLSPAVGSPKQPKGLLFDIATHGPLYVYLNVTEWWTGLFGPQRPGLQLEARPLLSLLIAKPPTPAAVVAVACGQRASVVQAKRHVQSCTVERCRPQAPVAYRGLVAEPLKGARAAVEGDPGSDSDARFASVGMVLEVDVIVLQRAPQPLGEDVVEEAAKARPSRCGRRPVQGPR
jgi:hypothetical protein